MRKFLIFISCYFLSISFSSAGNRADKNILISPAAHVRVKFGADQVLKALNKIGYQTKIIQQTKAGAGKPGIVIGIFSDAVMAGKLPAGVKNKVANAKKEAYTIYTDKKGTIYIAGHDASGTLYGCIELADQIKDTGKLPAALSLTDQPEMVLRGTCIGLQKPDYLPGHDVYEYPYTPETFPWLYDKALWIKYLDMMVENRYNSLYLWNGHPFSSLLRLKTYHYAVEVDDATLKKTRKFSGF